MTAKHLLTLLLCFVCNCEHAVHGSARVSHRGLQANTIGQVNVNATQL